WRELRQRFFPGAASGGRRNRFIPPRSTIPKFQERYSSPSRPAPTSFAMFATTTSAFGIWRLPSVNCWTWPMLIGTIPAGASRILIFRGDNETALAYEAELASRVVLEPLSTTKRVG